MASHDADMIGILTRHLSPAFDMMEKVIAGCPDDLWTASRPHGPAPIWLHLYHALAGIDFWLRSTKEEAFDFPTFGKDVDPDIAKCSRDFLSKDEIRTYIERARKKAAAYAEAAGRDGLLSTWPFADTFTRADTFLGQIRHIQHHVGYCNSLLSSAGAPAAAWMAYGE